VIGDTPRGLFRWGASRGCPTIWAVRVSRACHVRCVSRRIARHWQVPDVVIGSTDRRPASLAVADGSVLFWYPRPVRRSVVAPLALLLPLTACRFDFDPVPAMPGDAAPDTLPPLPVLPCGAPAQFSAAGVTGSGSGSGSGAMPSLTAVAATATADGYGVLAVDGTGDVHGFSYAFDGALLGPRAAGAPVFSGATGTASAIDTGAGILAAIAYGRPDSTGTDLIPLDAQLAPHGALQRYSAWYTLDSAIAGTSSGALVFIGGQPNDDVVAKRVSPTGTDLGPSRKVIDGAEGISVATIIPAGARFLVTWDATTPSPNQVRAEVIDDLLSVVVPPTTINTGAMFDGASPHAGYAAAADRYLIAWSFKTSNSDELWVSLRDGQLAEQHAIRLSTHGVLPRVAAGKDDFLVAWKDTNTTSEIAAARVRFDGSVVPLVVTGNGRKALGWDVTARAGQPALIWIESTATPSVWFDPLCK
jgi:hypothetical protein